MKIRRNKGLDDAVRLNQPVPGSLGDTTQPPIIPPFVESDEDSVDISLAQALSRQLDPTAISKERNEKVELLKKLVKDGKYEVSSEKVALAIQNELTVEIMSARETDRK